jgi:hypothetical protein
VSLGVDGETALRGMARAAPDFGGLRAWRGRFGDPPRPALCVSAFAANEPESSALALEKIKERFPSAARTLVGLLSLREDRGDRTLQWVRAAGEGFFRDFARVLILGAPGRAALRKIRKTPCPGGTAFSRFNGSSPAELMSLALGLSAGEPTVVGFGNIVGPGERIVRYWNEKGTSHDH